MIGLLNICLVIFDFKLAILSKKRYNIKKYPYFLILLLGFLGLITFKLNKRSGYGTSYCV